MNTLTFKYTKPIFKVKNESSAKIIISFFAGVLGLILFGLVFSQSDKDLIDKISLTLLETSVLCLYVYLLIRQFILLTHGNH